MHWHRLLSSSLSAAVLQGPSVAQEEAELAALNEQEGAGPGGRGGARRGKWGWP